MRSSLLALALAIASTSAFGFQNQDYQFTTLAETSQPLGGYQMSAFADPAINNLGNVIFDGYVKAPIGSSTFLAGLFSPQGLVVPTNGSLPACLGPYAINDSGQIAFVENSKLSPTQPAVSGVYESAYSGGAVTTVLDPGATIDGVQLLGDLCSGSANSQGGFSFDYAGRIAFVDTGGLYKYTPKNGVTKINISKIDGQPATQLSLLSGQSEELLFQGSTSSFGAIFARDRVLVKTPSRFGGVDLTSILFGVASRDGEFVFNGSIGPASSNDFGLFTKDSVVAKSGQRIGGKVISTAGAPFLGSPAVNNRGEVIFNASFGTVPSNAAIFSHDAVIVAVGDSITDRTITALGQPALNDYGVIAFLATFSDGSQGIIEATPKWR